MKPGGLALGLAILSIFLWNLLEIVLRLELHTSEKVELFIAGLGILGIPLAFVAFFLSCYATVKGWKSKSGREVLLGALGIVCSLVMVVPVILGIILGIGFSRGRW